MRTSWKTALLAPGLLGSLVRAQSSFDSQLSGAPSANDFLRRWTPQGTVIGDYLYLDGGEVSQLVDGESLKYRNSNPVNDTLSLNLAESWDPENVKLKIISKPSEPMMRQAIFTDASEGVFYIWGGKTSYSARTPEPQLIKFIPRSQGDGSWTMTVPEDDSTFAGLLRTEAGAYVSTPDAAFHFGGVASSRTTTKGPEGPVPGYVRFNFTTQSWSNHSAGPWTGSGLLQGAAAVYVPTFGPNGLVMLLGGRDPGADFLRMDNVSFMDPLTGDWHWQMTQGSAPTSRMFHCAVGVESPGPNKTYEIFVYGGRNELLDTAFDDIHVLSLPGFVWRKADYESSSPRDSHACVVAGDGKRQMISFGGVDYTLEGSEFWQDQDRFPQGLGVFDLTEMKWKTRYDAGAATYEAPEAVQSWYADGGQEDLRWSSDEVERLFVQESEASEGGGNGGGGEGNGDGGDDKGSSSGGSSTAAIAGGVVGGVLGVALILGLVWFIRRRRAAATTGAGAGMPVAETDASKAQPMELHGYGSGRVEADGTPRDKPYELIGSGPGPYTDAVELDAGPPGQQPRYR